MRQSQSAQHHYQDKQTKFICSIQQIQIASAKQQRPRRAVQGVFQIFISIGSIPRSSRHDIKLQTNNHSVFTHKELMEEIKQ